MRYLLLTLLLAAPTLHAAGLDADRQLTNSLLAISQTRMPEALNALDLLTEQHPNFRLAQLTKGDVLLARAQPLHALGNLNGAFTLSYPHEWDTRQGRSGHGIWIHGSPSSTYSRAPRASEGCVVLANYDLTRLGEYIKIEKTPVIIAEQIEWIAQDALNARRNDLAAAINQWRLDWESRNTTRQLSHYSASFHSGAQTLLAFAANKQRVNADKSWIKVGLDNVSLMLYPQGASLFSNDAEASTTPLNPERSDFALVNFVQNYQSNTLNDRTTKRQFWSRENGRWKIIHETSL